MSVRFLRSAVALLVLMSFPSLAQAFPFGGQITLFHVCYNETLFARLSPPVPGDYVWTTATKTYQFGPPQSTGQWLLGLTGIPFDCLWSVSPIFPVPAISIMMMGSSQAGPLQLSSGGYTADPTLRPSNSGGTPVYSGPEFNGQVLGGGGSGGGSTISSGILITEVYATPASPHGTDPTHEWIELYNFSSESIDLSGWRIQDNTSTHRIPSGTSIGARSFLIVTHASGLKNLWDIPAAVRVVRLEGEIGTGLSRTGDIVRLRNANNGTVDMVSWGTNPTAFNPPATIAKEGQSMARRSKAADTNTSNDWTVLASSTPGR